MKKDLGDKLAIGAALAAAAMFFVSRQAKANGTSVNDYLFNRNQNNSNADLSKTDNPCDHPAGFFLADDELHMCIK